MKICLIVLDFICMYVCKLPICVYICMYVAKKGKHLMKQVRNGNMLD
jgi:hypothetical protein